MKRVVILVLSFLIILTAVGTVGSASADTESGGFTYALLADGTASITGCSLEGDVVIPSEIDGYTVTNLAANLFYGRGDITSVSVPATVTYFGQDPKDNMWDYVFSYCFCLESITVDPDNTDFCSVDGVLYSKDKTQLINYPPARKDTSYRVPAAVTDLYCTSFASAQNLTSLYLDGTDTWWYTYTFFNCGSLTVYYRPGGLTEIKVNQEKQGGRSHDGDEVWPVYTENPNNGSGEEGSSEEEPDNRSELDKKVEWVVANYTNESMTDDQKARALHDWLTENAYYDTTMATPNAYNAEGVLLDGTGVCDSYSKAYSLLLSKAGIREIRITGNAISNDSTVAESHSWNLVQLGGKWYQVDVTWDDPIGGPDQKKSGLEHHMYYKAPRRIMDATHFPDEESKVLVDSLVEKDSEVLASGSCGENVKWELTGEGLLTVSGTGPMEDYAADTRNPWYELSVEKVAVESGITSIGKYAFSSRPITDVSLPDTVTRIDDYAFSGCSLESIVIPKNVTYIGEFAFYGCRMESVIIPDSVTSIGNCAFGSCFSLKTAVLSAGLSDIGINLFSQCKELTEVVIPEGPASIGACAFAECENLKTVTIPDSVKDIFFDSFTLCTQLSTIHVQSQDSYAYQWAVSNGYQVISDESESNGWKEENGKWYYFENGKPVTGWFSRDGIWYWFDGSGTMATSWLQLGASWYYFDESGAMATGTRLIDGSEYTFGADGIWQEKAAVTQTGWLQDEGNWYYYDENGTKITGWLSDSGNWYYMQPSGAMATGWISDGSDWYYMRSSGVMATGWISDGGAWYYMKPSGAMATGWISDGCDWYYMRSSGAMATGWIYDGGAWYYMKSSGAMATGWTYSDGSWYYFRNSGKMATGWFEDKEAEAQLPADQKRALWYWFDENGAMAKGWKEINGQWEMFADNGEWLYTWDGN